MEKFIFIFFFIFLKINSQQTYKSYFLNEYLSIINIEDDGIKFYHYVIFNVNSVLKYNFQLNEQKINSNSEGDMTSLCFLKSGNNNQLFIIVKNYIYSFSSKFLNYFKIDNLTNIPSSLISNKFYNNICSFFIAFINSEKKLEIYKYEVEYETEKYSLKNSKIINLINSSGQTSLSSCDFISCQKATNENNLEVLVCFFENDNSEIGAITLNLDTLERENTKEVKLKRNSGAKSIKSTLFDNNQKVFVCYINNYNNIICIIFDECQNIFLNEYKYIEKISQSQRYFNIDYFSKKDQYVLSSYSSENEFEFIIFDNQMNIIDRDSKNQNTITKIELGSCSELRTIIIFLFTNYESSIYKIAQKCGNLDFNNFPISNYTSEPLIIEEFYFSDISIKSPDSTLFTGKFSTYKILSSENSSTDIISSSLLFDNSSIIIDKSSTVILSPTLFPDKYSIDIISSSIFKKDFSTNIITSNIYIEKLKYSTNIISSTIFTENFSKGINSSTKFDDKNSMIIHNEILTNKASTLIFSNNISTNIKSITIFSNRFSSHILSSSNILSDKFITNISSIKESFDNIGRNIIKYKTNKTLEIAVNNIDKLIEEAKIGTIYEIIAKDYLIKISPINYNQFEESSTYINFLDCEKSLRNKYHLSENDFLTEVIIEIEKNDEKSLTNQIEYAVFYGKKRLDLSVCANNEIEINYDISNSTNMNFEMVQKYSELGIDIINIRDIFFNDICYPYSENKVDIILKDRISVIYQNYSKCDENCEYEKIELNEKLITCKCKVKTEIIQDIGPPRLDSILLDILTNSTFGVVKCYNLVFNFHNKLENIGFLLFTMIDIAHMILIIYYFIYNIIPINKYILSEMKKYYYIAEIYNPIKKNGEKRKSKLNKYNNVQLNIFNINKKDEKSKVVNQNYKFFQNLNLNEEEVNSKIKLNDKSSSFSNNKLPKVNTSKYLKYSLKKILKL